MRRTSKVRWRAVVSDLFIEKATDAKQDDNAASMVGGLPKEVTMKNTLDASTQTDIVEEFNGFDMHLPCLSRKMFGLACVAGKPAQSGPVSESEDVTSHNPYLCFKPGLCCKGRRLAMRIASCLWVDKL